MIGEVEYNIDGCFDMILMSYFYAYYVITIYFHAMAQEINYLQSFF